MYSVEQKIITDAINEFKPRHIVTLFSGGYDSMVTAHLMKSLDTSGVPLSTWAVDTKLSADGWLDYVKGVATELDFPDFNVWDNAKGFNQFCEFVRLTGCPRTRAGHTHAFRRLKERGFSGIHMLYKQDRHDKTLFVSGMRRAESAYRQNADEYHRSSNSSMCFASPLVHWSDERVLRYRIENDLPHNPFYETVKGSGDCQCNWGNFISYGTLEKYSPSLASGNVATIDRLSIENHGYGWDGYVEAQLLLPLDDCELDGEFLCSNCSRRGDKHRIAEEVYLQRMV